MEDWFINEWAEERRSSAEFREDVIERLVILETHQTMRGESHTRISTWLSVGIAGVALIISAAALMAGCM